MASNYRMNIIWSSQGAQLQRDINTFIGSMGQMEGRVQRNQRQMSLWGQQMRAIGTTIRYALAGVLVYSVATAINSLGDFEAKLGQIDALVGQMGSGGKIRGMGSELDKLGDSALQTSLKFGVAASDVQEYFRAFASAGFAPVVSRNRKEMEAFATAMSEFQVAAGTEIDPLRMASALTALLRGAGKKPSESARKYTSELFEVLRISPVLYGADISRDLGRLMAARQATRMTPEQILGIYAAASIQGGSPAVIGRGVAQLLTSSLIMPRSTQAKSAFQEVIGTSDPNRLREMGGYKVIRQILQAASGIRIQNPGALGAEGLEDPEALAQAGVTRGKGKVDVKLLSRMFTRVESVRVLLNLISSMQKYGDVVQQSTDKVKRAGEREEIERRAQLANARRFYQKLTIEQQTIGLSMARGLAPVLQVLEERIMGPIARFSVRHPTATLGIVAGAGGAALAARLGAASILSGGLRGGLRGVFGRFARRGPEAVLASQIGAGLGGFNATGLAMQGMAAGAGSRANPLWVMIDPFSWFLPGAPSGQAPGTLPTEKAPGGVLNWARRQAGRIATGAAGGAAAAGRWLPWAGKVGAGTAALGIADIVALLSIPGATEDRDSPFALTKMQQRRYPFLSRLVGNLKAGKTGYSRGTQEQITRFATGDISAAHFERWLRVMALKNAQGRSDVQIEGEAALKIGIELSDDARRLLRISAPEGMPVKLWSQGNPQHRGKNKTTRKGPRGPAPGTGPR